VPLSDEALAAFRDPKAVSFLRSRYVFVDGGGGQLSHKAIYVLVPRIWQKAGLAKRLTFHDLRHSVASHPVMGGVALKAVQEILPR
jgi:site-specific recombinase XerD